MFVQSQNYNIPEIKDSKHLLPDNLYVNIYIYIGYSPAHPSSPRYAEIIDKGIRKLITSGEIQFFLKKYGLKEAVYMEK
jgi:ABC-type amino acid transport substrate-binding protein